MIYFIRAGFNGPIKIGYSKSENTLKRRLSSLQTASPHKLELIGIIEGNKRVENALHIKYQAYQIQGEWFAPEPPLLEYITKVCNLEEKLYVFDFDSLKNNTLDDILFDIESRFLSLALKKTGHRKQEAAELLGISFRTFRYRLSKRTNRE